MTGRVLLVFLDGVGIGPHDPEVNPFAWAGARGLIPTHLRLLGGVIPTTDNPRISTDAGQAFPLAAHLDMEGTPQSGTGQTALLTGENAAEIHGSHFGPWVPVALRELVEERSLLKRGRDAGRSVAFANAYPRDWESRLGTRRIAAPPLAARGAAALTRHEKDLGEGRAVASEIVNTGWRRHLGHGWLPEVTPEQAGANLARIAAAADLTLYAHYSTDSAGHKQSMPAAVSALERVDRFLAGLLEAMPDDLTLLVASDHGNLEDVSAGHTLNPALGLAVGPGAGAAAELDDLREVTPFILELLEVPRDA